MFSLLSSSIAAIMRNSLRARKPVSSRERGAKFSRNRAEWIAEPRTMRIGQSGARSDQQLEPAMPRFCFQRAPPCPSSAIPFARFARRGQLQQRQRHAWSRAFLELALD